jgi:hypothetical protein
MGYGHTGAHNNEINLISYRWLGLRKPWIRPSVGGGGFIRVLSALLFVMIFLSATVSAVNCTVEKKECDEKCKDLCDEAKRLNCEKMYSGCALDVFCCGTMMCSYSFKDYFCDKPGYLACIEPFVEKYRECLKDCNTQFRARTSYGDGLRIRSECKKPCEDEWHRGAYEVCRPAACKAWCIDEGYPDGNWTRVYKGRWDYCLCEGTKATTTSTTTTLAPDQLKVAGKITDGFGHPIKHARVTFKYEGQSYTGLTDKDGRYEFVFTGRLADRKEGRLYVKLQYERDGKIYYRIRYGGKTVWIMKKFTIDDRGDLTQDFDLRDGLSPANNHYGDPNPLWIRHYSIMHHHMTEALEFYKDELKANVDYKLPVDVITFVGGGRTYYTPATGSIVIASAHAKHDHPYRPMNREWHEFGHHVQYSMYGKWPEGRSLPNTKNHDGYINPSTADSFMEGFAEWGSMVIADHYRYPSPHVYSSFGSWERDYKAWEWRGRAEELAVAGILWDLYDPKNDDKIDLTLLQIWNIVKTYHRDFTAVYNATVRKFPGFKADIDAIFKEHGFFADKTEGNRRHDPQEPFRDADGDKAFDAGEYYVDYAQEPHWVIPWMIRQENEPIGSATNYQRPARMNTVLLPGHFVKVDNDVPYYRVKVEFRDDPGQNYETRTFNDNGLVYVQMPPYGVNATITVTAEGVATGRPLSFTTQDFNEKWPESVERGYYVEHDFRVSGAPAGQPAPEEVSLSASRETPYWEWGGDARLEDYVYKPPVEEPLPLETELGRPALGVMPSAGGGVPNWVWLAAGGTVAGLIILVVVVGLFVVLVAAAAYIILRKRGKSR